MKRWLALFLILCAPAFADMACLVGGTSSDALHGGWIDLSTCTVAQATGANGQAVIEMTAVAYDHTGGTVEKMFSKAGIGTGVTVGVYAYVSGTNITAGYYKVTTVAGDGSYVAINVTATGDNADSVVNIGGALPLSSLQAVSDDAIGSAAALNVTVYCTGSLTTALTIDFDANGGSATTRKTFKAADANYAYSKGGCTLTATANLLNGVISFGTAGAGPAITYVDLIGFTINGGGAGNAEYGISCLNDNADYISIVNCTITNVVEAPGDGIAFGGDYATLCGITIDDCARGIFCNNADGTYNTYLACRISDSTGDGVFLDGSASTVVGCEFIDNGDDGLELDDGAIWSQVSFCTTINNTGDGYYIHAAAVRGGVADCSSSGNGGFGYNFGATNVLTVALFGFNHSYNETDCSDTGTWATLGLGDNITGDPLFVSVVDGSEDLDYQATSPCIAAGLGGANIGAGNHAANTGGAGFPVTSTIGGHVQH